MFLIVSEIEGLDQEREEETKETEAHGENEKGLAETRI